MTILLFVSMLPVSGTSPFTIYGFVTNHNGQLQNGISITVVDINKSQSLKTTTIQGENSAGLYQVNLGNMVAQWSRGDQISVYASYWDGPIHYYGISEFTLPDQGYSFLKNVSVTNVESGVGYLSNCIETTVVVI